MSNLALVTGANGHLGNNVVRALLDRGTSVRASVRNPDDRRPFAGLDLDLVRADLLDPDSLRRALAGVDTLYQVAAVFRQWARDPRREIIDPAVIGTRNILEAAADAGVRRVIYVSSTVTLERGDGAHDDWRREYFGNPYYEAKIESEKLAWQLAEARGLDMVTVLPDAIAGPYTFRSTPTIAFFERVIEDNLPFDLKFKFNFVDGRDVADAMVAAAERGVRGERYVLAGAETIGTDTLVRHAQAFKPELRMPPTLPKSVALGVASLSELSGLIGREPMLLRSQVHLYYDNNMRYDSSKAARDLGFTNRPVEAMIHDTYRWLLHGTVEPATVQSQMG